MRSARRLLVVPFAIAAAFVGLAQGCQDATQATLEIRMLKSELCSKSGGTAIAVGSDRDETEARITTYVTAETRDCEVSTGTIGSLVITPGESGKAAIVVAVAFDTSRARTASDCKPPAYAGCIVARRFLGFASHKNLRLPITIDPDCLDVPCNAVSTCRKGNCYDSTTVNGEEPGDDGMGGALEGGIVDGSADGFTPDASKPDGSAEGGADGSADGASDGSLVDGSEGGTGKVPFCRDDAVGGPSNLYCVDPGGGPLMCGASPARCCHDPPSNPVCQGTACGTQTLCCKNEDCPMGFCCPAPGAGGSKSQPRACQLGPADTDGGLGPAFGGVSQCAL